MERQVAEAKRRERELKEREDEEQRKAPALNSVSEKRIAELERSIAETRKREEENRSRLEQEKSNAASRTDKRIADLERELGEIARREQELKKEQELRKAASQTEARIAQLERQLDEAKQREAAMQEEARKSKLEREQLSQEEVAKKTKDQEIASAEAEARTKKSGRDQKTMAVPMGRRVALVIGINSYENLPPLKTAVNDAAAVSKALQGMGFNVIEGSDLTRRGFYMKWAEFLGEIEGGGTTAFFFAGHGIQSDGLNFLLPKDAADTSVMEEVLRRESISFSELRSDLQRRRPSLSLFILDACRNNPYRGVATRSMSGVRGLAPVEPLVGTFVMYSADPGEEAIDRLPSDGAQDVNSLYTRHLIPLLTGDQTLQAIAQIVRSEVRAVAAKVKHSQTPAYYDGVIGLACLSAQCVSTPRSSGR